VNVALVHHGRGVPAVHDLAASLRQLGHQATVLGSNPTPLDPLLERRGFTTPLGHLPFTLGALLRGHYDIAHAFSAQDVYATLHWRRRSRNPVVFSCAEPIEREQLSNRRLRLRLLRTALEESDAVIVQDDAARAAAWRWLALEPPVIAAGDGAAHERLYRRLLAQT
jgi:Glycosyltransferase Family 4